MRILLADDHRLFLSAMNNLLVARGLNVVGTARDGQEAIEQARLLRPDLILMDIQMPCIDGLMATRILKTELPEIKVVMLTMQEDDNSLFDAIKNGAAGYLLKSEEPEIFFHALLALAKGETPLSAGLAARILKEFGAGYKDAASAMPSEELSARQMEVLALVADGLTYKEVGKKLALTERTIKYHMGEIVQRLQVENKTAVIRYAQRTGLMRLK